MLGIALRHQIITFLFSKRDRHPRLQFVEWPLQVEKSGDLPRFGLGRRRRPDLRGLTAFSRMQRSQRFRDAGMQEKELID